MRNAHMVTRRTIASSDPSGPVGEFHVLDHLAGRTTGERHSCQGAVGDDAVEMRSEREREFPEREIASTFPSGKAP